MEIKKILTVLMGIFVAGLALYLECVLHEGSHAICALALGGEVINSHVGFMIGSVETKIGLSAQPYVAMAPFILPTLLVFGLSFVRIKKHTAKLLWASFVSILAIGPFMECVMNAIAVFSARENMEHWDLLHAIDASSGIGAALCIAIVLLALVLLTFVIIRSTKSFYNEV